MALASRPFDTSVALISALLVAVVVTCSQIHAQALPTETGSADPSPLASLRTDLAITDVNLIAMDGEATVREGVTVVVRGGLIEAAIAGRRGLDRGLPVVDGGGRFLIPGLIDMHVHVRDTAELGLHLAAGVTTVRNMNGAFGDALAWKARIAEGTLLGPRFVTASPTLYDESETYRWHVETPDRARALARQFATDGYDMIKVFHLREPTMRALVDEADRVGLPVVGHIPTPSAELARVLDLVMSSLEHLDEFVGPGFGGVSDYARIPEVAESIRASGVAVGTILSPWEAINRGMDDPTFLAQDSLRTVAVHYFGAEGLDRLREMAGGFRSRTKADLDRDRSDFDFLFALVRALDRVGVPVVASTDAHQVLAPAGEALHNELELLARAGLSNEAALRTATTNAAEVLGLSDQIGTIAPGRRADLLLLRENPLQNLAALRAPIGVMIDGRWLDRAALSALGTGERVPPAPPVAGPPDWAVVLDWHPDPSVVVDEDVRARIGVSGLPWRVTDRVSGIEMLLVPPGSYWRGAAPDDPYDRANERPRHRVELTRAFYLGRYEVTNEQLRRVRPEHSSGFFERDLTISLDDPELPAVNVSWEEAVEFAEALDLRLPTEAEWEFAARAGVSSRYPWGNDPDDGAGWGNGFNAAVADRIPEMDWDAFPWDDGWVGTAPGGSFRANAWGFFDLFGNVWEYVADSYDEDLYATLPDPVVDPRHDVGGPRTLRGGGFGNAPRGSGIPYRYGMPADSRHFGNGFRVARDPG